MRHSYSMFNVFIRCKIRYASTQSNILVFCIPNQYSYFYLCLSMQFWYSVWMLLCRVRYAYYMIQYSCLDIELHAWVTWPWDGRSLDKVFGLKIIALGSPVVPHVPGDTVMADSGTSGKTSANNAKATLCCVAEQLLTIADRGGLYCWFLASLYY